MSVILEVEHHTVYRYKNPVSFGEHKLMFRPRPSHDLRVLECSLDVSPDAEIRWVQDLFSNSVTYARIPARASELRFTARITLEHLGTRYLELPLTPGRELYPFEYAADELPDLRRYIEPAYPDPSGVLRLWIDQFRQPGRYQDNRDLLIAIARGIRAQFAYAPRDAEGVQPPLTTLRLKSGTCRDFSLFMMEAVRRLGFAARFVSGYLYDPALDDGKGGMTGAGSTHAWMQVYLPGAGWVPFDPTNTIFGGENLICVAQSRDPSQASPLSGGYTGRPDDFIGMEVKVSVTKRDTLPNRLQGRA